MRILAVSVSHKTAPIYVRELMAFTKKKQAEILQFVGKNIASECVLVSTCNRCEFYLVSEHDVKDAFIAYLNSVIVGQKSGFDIMPYIEFYEQIEAVSHLMSTAAGLQSMVIGEDQILGQIKEAHGYAVENGTSGIYCNTLFRLAITGAKKVKTETLLSKTPVSVATIAIKLCENYLGTLKNKNAMIIGATGKMGGIIFKDLLSLECVNLFVTTRTHDAVLFEDFADAEIIDYSERYSHLDKMDIVISATSSPHYTLTADMTEKSIKTQKDRIFIDLAVPKDIEESEKFVYKNIDNLRELSEINNEKKIKEAEKAEQILKKYLNEFLVWQIFYENKNFFEAVENKLGNEGEISEFRREIYEAKANMDYIAFGNFVNDLRRRYND
jgi:glutamyl-tRNA reductase